MRCPKCQYIAFDDAATCPNCGDDLSRALDLPADADLQTTPEMPGPLADFSLGPLESDPSLLPFPFGSTGHVTARRRPPPLGAPLSVRRATPEVSRLRTTPAARSGATELALRVDTETAERQEEEHVPQSETETAHEAAVAERLLAGLIDLGIVTAMNGAVIYFTLRLTALSPSELAALPMVPLTVFLAMLTVGYSAGLTGAGGQTIGKMALGLRVIAAGGGALSWSAAFARTFAYLVSVLLVGLGFVMAALTRDRRTLHDRLAATRVVRLS
jgi:uncharacterized RDD family membrane protein YckC